MKPALINLLLCSVLVFCCSASRTQKWAPAVEKGYAKSTPAKDQSTQPAAELQSLGRAFSGNWSLAVKYAADEKMPNGFTGTGQEIWHAGPGGFTLLEEERLPSPRGDAYLLGVLWWDSGTKKLQGMECNNHLPYTCDLKGALNDITLTWDGKQFAIDERETHNHKTYIWHEAWSEITESSFLQTGDVREPDGRSTRLFTIRGTKVSGRHASSK